MFVLSQTYSMMGVVSNAAAESLDHRLCWRSCFPIAGRCPILVNSLQQAAEKLLAWELMKSFCPKEGGDDDAPASGGRNAERDFRGERRSNATHASSTDADARLYRKGQGQPSRPTDKPSNSTKPVANGGFFSSLVSLSDLFGTGPRVPAAWLDSLRTVIGLLEDAIAALKTAEALSTRGGSVPRRP